MVKFEDLVLELSAILILFHHVMVIFVIAEFYLEKIIVIYFLHF